MSHQQFGQSLHSNSVYSRHNDLIDSGVFGDGRRVFDLFNPQFKMGFELKTKYIFAVLENMSLFHAIRNKTFERSRYIFVCI